MKKIKEFIKRHDGLYVLVKTICSLNDPNLVKLLRGFYGKENTDSDTLLIEHYGVRLPDELVYDISTGVNRITAGFAAELHHLLYKLHFAEFINASPRVFWGDKTLYYERQMDGMTRNVFEYYFEPISDLSEHPITNFRNVIISQERHVKFYQDMFTNSYCINDEHLRILSEQYKKSIRLNHATREFVYKGIEKMLATQRTLGIHVRGTDFNLGLLNHPKVVSLQDYLNEARTVFNTGKYDRIFLATEDLNAVDLFSREFEDKVVYYKDTFRAKNVSGLYSIPSERPLHHYKLGLEVLRDIYTLASCDGLVCGLSHVSFAARYVNLALDRKFEEVRILDHGINRQD